METLKVAYADFWPEWPEENFIEPILREHFNVVVDQDKPDVLFHSRGFYQKPVADNYNCKKILFLGENHRPSQFKTDYSITFDPPTETNFRLPLWQAFILKQRGLKDRLFGEKFQHKDFKFFASFVVSNPSNFIRNGHFDKLSTYKPVQSYGRFKTNDMALVNYSKGKYWRDAKDIFFIKYPHKFMMTYENNSYPWYCTEKIMDAYLAGSIPIYWGDPKVVVDWNLDSFINVTKLGSSWFDAVKAIDQDPALFQAMYDAPIFKDEQKQRHLENMEEFENWLIKNTRK
jgi:hypothetical protein